MEICFQSDPSSQQRDNSEGEFGRRQPRRIHLLERGVTTSQLTFSYTSNRDEGIYPCSVVTSDSIITFV